MVRTRVSTLEAEQCALQSTPSTRVAGHGTGRGQAGQPTAKQ